jgi:toxin-antitoxin system PIN domain toxin
MADPRAGAMNLLDSNVWIALALSKHAFHAAVSNWFDRQTGRSTVLFCRPTQQSFLRLLTTRSVMASYDLPWMDNSMAWRVFEQFLGDSRIGWADEPSGLESRWKRFSARGTASSKLWMDAYLAAFAAAGGYKLITTDRGFAQFEGLDATILPERPKH